jgi:CDP-6-deoxy-D-xylo-4-hexulose-3-dehydrase
MFALPIVIGQEHGEEKAKYFIDKIKGFAEELGIETRPIVGGNLLRQTIFQEYGDYNNYPNAEWFHNYGIYVGLYKKMNKRILMKFRDKIDTL